MSKVDIAGMMATKATKAEPAAPTPSPPRATAKSSTKKTAASSKKAASKTPSVSTTGDDLPKWQRCEPQTVYLWPDATDDLKDLARQLQRAKAAGVGERITMATLVRVAVARLLEDSDKLTGTTEAELLAAVRKS